MKLFMRCLAHQCGSVWEYVINVAQFKIGNAWRDNKKPRKPHR